MGRKRFKAKQMRNAFRGRAYALMFHPYSKQVVRTCLNASFWAGRMKRVLASRRATHPLAVDNPTLKRFHRFNDEFAGIGGWFSQRSLALWDSLLQYQCQQQMTGNLLEIGTFKGKSAACLSLHARREELCVFVDRLILAELKHTTKRIRAANNLFIECDSRDLSKYLRDKDLYETFRWIHIDGEHSGQALTHDLANAASLLGPDGIVCIDDFPSDAYPQVIFCVSEFLAGHPDLVMFVCGFNKGYICRVLDSPRYLQFVKDDLFQEMSARGHGDVTIWKSSTRDDYNCFGITERVKDFDYRGPDWRPHDIEI